MAPIRRGGRATLGSGELLTWSSAEGARGTRIRESITEAGGAGHAGLRRALLLEVDPDGRLTRLEIATAAGLLTLHPDDAGASLHGNVVTPGGIRHLTFAWGPDHVILLADSPAVAAVAMARLADRTGPTARGWARTVLIDDKLVPRAERRRVERRMEGSWAIHPAVGIGPGIVLDPRGTDGLDDPGSWPLES